jgi:RNase P subunit RPR2
VIVKPVKDEETKANTIFLYKGKNSFVNNSVKLKFKAHLRKQTQAKLVLTCHHCGIVGHIRPNCCQLKSQRPWNKKDAPKKDKDVVEFFVSKYVPAHRRQHSQRFVPTCHHCGKIGHI